MANKILFIGVGSAGLIAVDKMNLPDSKKLFIDTDYYTLNDVKSDGIKMELVCKDVNNCSGFCHCYDLSGFCKKVACDNEDEIRERIKDAWKNEE